MNREVRSEYEGVLEGKAGVDPFERSENGATPAARPPVEYPEEAIESEERDANTGRDDQWEDAGDGPPTSGRIVGRSGGDTWGEEVLLPAPKTRYRGTLAPAAERPELPMTPQQKLLLLDTWLRSRLTHRSVRQDTI